MKKLITFLSTILLLTLAVCGGAFAQSPDPKVADAFPLLGWWGPTSEKEAVYAYRRCGFSVMPMPYGRVSKNIAEYARQIGLTVALDLPNPESTALPQIRLMMEHIMPVSHIVAGENVSANQADQWPAFLQTLSEVYPDARLVTSLRPTTTNAEWRAALPELQAKGLDAFLFDFLALGEGDETKESEFFSLLATGRELQLEHGLDHWAMVHVTPTPQSRRASESDIRFQAYTALAYGARGLAYFAFSDPPTDTAPANWGPPMVELKSGEVQYGYTMTGILNQELRQLVPHLLELKSTGVYGVGDVPEVVPQLPGEGEVFRRVIAPQALCGFFEAEDGTRWAMLVNLRHGDFRSAQTTKTTVQVVVDPEIEALIEIDRYTGYEKPVPCEDGNFFITLPGGTGSLFRVPDEAN